MDREFVEAMCRKLKESALCLASELSLSSHRPHVPGSLNAALGFLDKLESTLEDEDEDADEGEGTDGLRIYSPGTD